MDIYEIAKKAGVSATTISRVLNKPELVNINTRKKIIDILNEYNYVPNQIARSLTLKKTQTIGVLAVNIASSYNMKIILTIEREFNKTGYSVILCNSSADIASKSKYLKILSSKMVDGIITIGSIFTDRSIKNDILSLSKDIPFILINDSVEAPNIYSVFCDVQSGMEKVIDFLCRKGHQNIVFVRDIDNPFINLKVEGFRRGLDKNNRNFDENSILTVNRDLIGGYQSVEMILNSNKKIDAMIFCDDLLAFGAIKRLKQLNIKVPEDMAIVGFNNSDYALFSDPEITSVDSKIDFLGETAFRKMISVLNNKSVESITTITPNLVIRGSA